MKTRGRVSLRDKLLANQSALNMYAIMAGKPNIESTIAIPPAPKKRVAKVADIKKPLEKDILKAILQLLKNHPKVHWVARFNSGTFMNEDRYIRSNSQNGMSDIVGMLKGGRLFAIECKSAIGKVKDSQQLFLGLINAGGGLAFVARSVDDVISKI